MYVSSSCPDHPYIASDQIARNQLMRHWQLSYCCSSVIPLSVWCLMSYVWCLMSDVWCWPVDVYSCCESRLGLIIMNCIIAPPGDWLITTTAHCSLHHWFSHEWIHKQLKSLPPPPSSLLLPLSVFPRKDVVAFLLISIRLLPSWLTGLVRLMKSVWSE